MNFKKILALCLSLAMMLTCFSFTAMAEMPEDYVSTGGTVTVNGAEYDSLDEAANSVTEATDTVEYVISGKVEYVTGTDLAKGAEKVVISGDGELTLTKNYHLGITANNAALEIKDITINDKSDLSNAEKALTAWEFAYIVFDGTNDITLTNVTFTEGVQIWDKQSATIIGCNFDVDVASRYSLWVGSSGEVVVNNCEFNGTRGVKTHGAYDAAGAVVDVEVKNCTFNGLTEKPALVHSCEKGGEIVIENNTYVDSKKGVYASEAPGNITGNDLTLVNASVTADGETTYYLTEEDAIAEADGNEVVKVESTPEKGPALGVTKLVGSQLDIGNYVLDTAVRLTAVDTEEDLATSPYAKYGVDFELSFDKATTAILAGEYGSYGWIALAGEEFEEFGINEDGYTFEADKPVRVMATALGVMNSINSSVSTNHISYEQVVSEVKKFQCGIKVTGDETVTATLKLVVFPVEVVNGENVYGRAIEVYSEDFLVESINDIENKTEEEKVEFVNSMGVDKTNAEDVATIVADLSNEAQKEVSVEVYGKIADKLTTKGDALVAGDKDVEVTVNAVDAETKDVTNAILLNGEVHEVTATVNGEKVDELDYPVIVKITLDSNEKIVKSVLHDHNGTIETLDFYQVGTTVYVKMHKFSQISLVMGASASENKALLTAVLSETSDNKVVYDLVLEADELDTIRGVLSGEFKVALDEDEGNAELEITAADKVVFVPKADNKYEFYLSEKEADDTYWTENILEGKIVLGQITVTGTGDNGAKGTIDFADEIIAKGFNSVEGYSNSVRVDIEVSDVQYFIPVATKTLTIVLDMRHGVKELSAMSLTVTGGGEVKSVDLTTATPVEDENEENHKTYTYAVKVTKGGNYSVKISGKGYRSFTQTGIDMTKDTTVKLWNSYNENGASVLENGDKVKSNFLAGDIIDDGVVNKFDLSAVVSYTGKTTTSELVENDINRDGYINSLDTAIVVKHMGK